MSLKQQLRQRALQATNGARNMAQQLKIAQRKKAEMAAYVAQTADGLSPAFRAQLHVAAKRAAEDPQAAARLERADTERRVRDARKQAGIGQAIPPDKFLGVPVPESELPKGVGERRRKK